MKTKIHAIVSATVLICLAGCATPFHAPKDAAHIKLERGDSRAVIVDKIWLERDEGPLVVKGYVVKRIGALTTTYTHLDVTVYGSDGRVLSSSVERFIPQEIQKRLSRPGHASYSVKLTTMPAGIARVEVRAHEGEHPNRD